MASTLASSPKHSLANLFRPVKMNHKSTCDDLSKIDRANFGISLFILIGIVVSYSPQHWKLIRRRTSAGISPYFVLLGTTSSTCALGNIFLLSGSQECFECCKQISGLACLSALMGVAQVSLQWACFTVILILFLIFFPRSEDAMESMSAKGPSYRTAVNVAALCLLHFILLAILSNILLMFAPQYVDIYAKVLGSLGAILAVMQYLPQLETTWRLKSVGSLSIPMMCLQTPGSFLWAWSLARRYGWEGWSSWGLFLATGVLQGSVLLTGSIFEVRRMSEEKKTRSMAAEVDQEGPSERTPLVSNGPS